MPKLYDFLPSGNSYKIRLLLNQLNISYERIGVDLLAGETRTPEFLAQNPNGKIPLMVLDDGTQLAESNAIIYFFAEGTPYFPSHRLERAQVMQWMFYEQYSHEPYIATSRFWLSVSGTPEKFTDKLKAARAPGLKALTLMENHLQDREWFVAQRYSIADIALYAYTHNCHEGGFLLDEFPNIRAWVKRVAEQPRHIRIDA